MVFLKRNLPLSQKLSTSTKVSQLCCAECATLIKQSAEAVQMFLNAEEFWTNYLDSTEPTAHPYEDQFKSEELLSNDGSIEILDSSIKEEELEVYYDNYKKKNDLKLEMTVALSITPACQTIFNGESEEEDVKNNFNIVHNKDSEPSDCSIEEYTIT